LEAGVVGLDAGRTGWRGVIPQVALCGLQINALTGAGGFVTA
jgi:hypothetical protein